MNSYEIIKQALVEILEKRNVSANFSLDKPEDSLHGDYATNIAFILSKTEKLSPKDCANNLINELQTELVDTVEKTEVAGAGFINFFLKDDVRTKEVVSYKNLNLNILENKKVICEYTDPNPFKLFHIGHLVPNAIGESISRIYEAMGASVSRINYQGDVGMHVAKTIFGVQWLIKHAKEETNKFFTDKTTLVEKINFLGACYSLGNAMYEDQHLYDTFSSLEEKVNSFKDVNKKIFNKTDEEINKIYDLGRKWSLEYFETIYKKLGTKFDYYIFESEVFDNGKKIVLENTPKVFEESDGAIVYKGEKVGLHTRVFINKEGLPTYEAKEIGNAFRKQELVPDNDISVIVTANEINEYFKVIKSALGEIDKNLSDKIKHVSHGMLRLPSGKMSSRTGNVIPAEELIDEVKEKLKEKLEDKLKSFSDTPKLLNDIAVGAIKFSILKQSPGGDIIFDFDKSISFEGDSGPYLQYTHARICTLLEKAESLGINTESYIVENPEKEMEQVLIGYRQVLDKAYKDLGPHHIVQYLLLLTRTFNTVYGRQQFVDENNKDTSAYYVMLAQATKNILAHGLHILGISAPTKM